jgi:hypothetical protein
MPFTCRLGQIKSPYSFAITNNLLTSIIRLSQEFWPNPRPISSCYSTLPMCRSQGSLTDLVFPSPISHNVARWSSWTHGLTASRLPPAGRPFSNRSTANIGIPLLAPCAWVPFRCALHPPPTSLSRRYGHQCHPTSPLRGCCCFLVQGLLVLLDALEAFFKLGAGRSLSRRETVATHHAPEIITIRTLMPVVPFTSSDGRLVTRIIMPAWDGW